MIEITDLTKTFDKFKALDSINASFKKGECIALIGPNGSGKTTLIKCILAMVIQNKGDITFNGINIKNDWKYRQHIGYMPQIGRYPDNTSIGQVLDMMRSIRKTGDTELDEELIYSFGLDKILDKRMRTLSGGTRQKVSAALAFLFRPDVLILDEPTAGLDPVASEILKQKIVKEKEKGRLILITSHILSELDDLVTKVVYMYEGRVLFDKAIDDIRKETGEVKLSKAIAHIMLNR